jgi:hypothetical protein
MEEEEGSFDEDVQVDSDIAPCFLAVLRLHPRINRPDKFVRLQGACIGLSVHRTGGGGCVQPQLLVQFNCAEKWWGRGISGSCHSN